MKKLAIIMTLLLLQTQIAATASGTYNKKPANKTQATKPVNNIKTTDKVYTQDGSDYLLKYNINDLESAPWLNNGKRKL
ncbi:MAG: hypothetical protein NC191_03090 [Muribaculaceae bacterium]|nr:hypothetical protein [Muribaculaceae bacterium]